MDDLTPEQIQEAADAVASAAFSAVLALALNATDWPWDVPDAPLPNAYVSSVEKPPPAPQDDPGGNGNNPPPTDQSPEPGTLFTGLGGAGALALRYLRRRRAKAAAGVNEGMALAS